MTNDVGTEHGTYTFDHQIVSQRGDVVIGRVRLICLEHRELRRVRGVDALVAEVAVDLEDALDAADDRALQEQLRRDAQVQIGVECIGVRDERARRRPAVLQLQHRGLDLDEPAVVQRRANGPHHLGAGAHHVASLRPDDQVDVALPDARLLVQLAVRDGQRAHRLRRHRPPVGHDRQLAALAGDHLALDEHVVAEVDLGLPAGQLLGAHARQAQHRLQLGAVALAQRRETQLAGVALEDHPAGDADPVAGGGVRRQVRMGGADLAQGVGSRDGDGIGVVAGGEHLGPLRPAHPDLLGETRVVLGGVGAGGRLGAHRPEIRPWPAGYRRRAR